MTAQTRVSEVKIIEVKKPKPARHGNYGGDITVVVATELDSNNGININLRSIEPSRTKNWLQYAKPGNVLKVHIGTTDDGNDYIDRTKPFTVVKQNIHQDSIAASGPVRQQVPMKDFSQPSADELINGDAYKKIQSSLERIRLARLEITQAGKDIEVAFKSIKS